tara:strand:- start:556 stop:1251 length:696 start_codon:yes stop_codon:yes gene_type:complete
MIYPMKTTNVKESKKNSSWFLAIPHEDEKGFEALAYLRENGYFNTPLFRLNRLSNQKQIVRYYLRFPQKEMARRFWYGLTDEELAEAADMKVQYMIKSLRRSNKRHYDNLVESRQENEQLKERIAQLEAENAKLRTECMTEDGLYDNDDVVDILESGQYGNWIKVDENKIVPTYDKPNQNFVTADMSATLGKGTHVLIDIDKVPKDLQVLLAKMMDTLNNHTLRISNLENC